MNNIKLEVCCGSAEDVFAAAKAGADRVELNSALFLGGLTPSPGTVRLAKKAGIPIMVMIRPREGGFCYSDSEISTMLEDIAVFSAEDIDGFVFGVLNPDGTVNREKNALLIKACGDKEKVFHRAIDVVPDWTAALDILIELGFDRVLTSGQAANAIAGAETIGEMVKYSNGRIEILPGGGIRPGNAAELLSKTGCTQLHSSCSSLRSDKTCSANPNISFRGSNGEDMYPSCDEDKIHKLLSAIGR
ncbi:MAG: copper homeostasis protein CutC [Firmicutes bacterium]|nr:copper homeostasis protein CutC [Bacillota bacterium]